ncbi:DUF2357 domain-containing protein [Clostridium sp.]|uniref:DUF2357 domain-containing protein n=1 Tax=Clostridium sp. TaxID=1506 RepID=UPI003D6C89A5
MMINEEIYNLAYGFLSRTYLGAEINNKKSNSYTEFYSILNYVYDKLMKAINIVLWKPHHELIKITEKIDSFVRTYSSTPWKKNEDIINKLNIMKKAVNSKLKTSFLDEVDSDYRNNSISLVFNSKWAACTH